MSADTLIAGISALIALGGCLTVAASLRHQIRSNQQARQKVQLDDARAAGRADGASNADLAAVHAVLARVEAGQAQSAALYIKHELDCTRRWAELGVTMASFEKTVTSVTAEMRTHAAQLANVGRRQRPGGDLSR